MVLCPCFYLISLAFVMADNARRDRQSYWQTHNHLFLNETHEIDFQKVRFKINCDESKKMTRNTWFAKFKRAFSAFFPIAQNRKGACRHCGACCCLPVRCWFLKEGEDGKQYCSIYKFRPPNCRKYPRTEKEFITEQTCGFSFEPVRISSRRKQRSSSV